MTTLNARPEAITFDAQQSALIVVDMQNAYASKGGYLDLAGFDVSATQPVIENIKTAVSAARAAGMLIVWFQNGWDDQYVEAGGPGSPNFHKSNALKTMRQRPELQARCWRKAAGIISWWMSWYRKLAISYCRNRATAAFSIPRSTACCAAGAFVIWSLRALPPTSAWSPPCATASSSSILAWCWKTLPIRPGRILPRKPPCSISKLFWLGQ